MFALDRDAAGIAATDASGRHADFHALRHTFITWLSRGGVTPRIAQELARHSDIRLTMAVYTHTLREDERAALDHLPLIDAPETSRPASGGAGGGGRWLTNRYNLGRTRLSFRALML